MTQPRSKFLFGLSPVPIGLAIFTTLYLWQAFYVRSSFGGGQLVGPKFLPIVAALMMYGAIATIVIRQIRDKSDARFNLQGMARPAKVVLVTLLYVAAFPFIGYALSTFPYVLVLYFIFEFEAKRPIRRIGFAALTTAVFYLLYAVIFGIRLPGFEVPF